MYLMKIILSILEPGDNMFQCNVCGSKEFKEEKVNKTFNINGEFVIVENIPAKVCKNCGEESFERDTLAHIQTIIYGEPKKIVQAKSFEYA
jgi:YgiT-type zinc finger domain-containing protein